MSRKKNQKAHIDYIPDWEDAMRFGLMDGRPHSEISMKTYTYYARWFLEQYQEISVPNLKKVLLTISPEHYGKRLKLFQALTCFAKFLVEEKILDAYYLVESKKLRPKRHLPEKKHTVAQKDLERLIEACESPLERLIVILLSHTGLRVSEAGNLKLEDINFEEKILTVRLAKWGKTRRVGLQTVVIETIQEYLKYRRETAEDWLFINRQGN